MQTQTAFITVFIIHIKPVFVCGEELDQSKHHDDVIFWVPEDTSKETFLLVCVSSSGDLLLARLIPCMKTPGAFIKLFPCSA